jgi:hypothetical protein
MNRTIGRPAAAFALAAVLAAPGAAQDEAALGPGVRVRVSVATSPDRLQGTVQAVDEAVLSVIGDDHQLVKVPRGSITRLETGWGRRGNAGKGFKIGALIGASGALLICAAGGGTTYQDRPFGDEDFDDCDGAGEWVGITLLAGGVYGGIGALIGHFIKSDRWVELPIERARVSVGPSHRGLGLSVSIRF